MSQKRKGLVETKRLIDVVREYISVKEIAAEVGVSVRVVNYWLSGQKKPGKKSRTQLEGLAKQFRGGEVKEKKELVIKDQESLTVKKGWYEELLFDLHKIETTAVVTGKWQIGERIERDKEKFGKTKYGDRTHEKLAKDFGISHRELDYCIKFYKMYPEFRDVISKLRGWTWFDITHKALPQRGREDKKELALLTVRQITAKCFAQGYSDIDPTWLTQCSGKCPKINFCRQLEAVFEQSPILKKEIERVEKEKKEGGKNEV